MVIKIANTLLKHVLKKNELRLKQKSDSDEKHTEKEKADLNDRLKNFDRNIKNVNDIRCFSHLDEYTKYGKSGFGIKKYDDKVNSMKDNLDDLLADSLKLELGYSKVLGDNARELSRTFTAATRIWHESVLGQDYEGEKAKAVEKFRQSKVNAELLAAELTAMRNTVVPSNH
jgi:hypothetical protein